jgi:hypothetical protein
MIHKEGKYWVLRSRESGRVLGRHSSKDKAERQEKAIHLQRLRSEGRIPQRRKRKKDFTWENMTGPDPRIRIKRKRKR